ncbi:MAG: bifunctional riboflavin kinase/FAD synthetase [Anaerolineae bacterium]|nr:bifunctional riboflavin kinase/FAD synthetase [Anaerolineae bacterium]
MELLTDLDQVALQKPSTFSIGVFDGVHLGHRYLIGELKQSAREAGRLTGVVTFDRHPDELLAPVRNIRYLTTLQEKVALLEELDLDFVVALPFTTKLAQTSARDFVALLVERLFMKQLWIGPDFALGRGRQGNAEYLRILADEFGFSLHRLQPLTRSGAVISSTAIRGLIREGRVREAASLLGRRPCVSGTVARGARRGHKLGFPTANLDIDDRLMIPAAGVYAARVHWESANHGGVVNIGTRPTFDDLKENLLEAHILDFSGDLYGRHLRVEFIERLRPEKRFPSPEALMAQMEKDTVRARRVLEDSDLR